MATKRIQKVGCDPAAACSAAKDDRQSVGGPGGPSPGSAQPGPRQSRDAPARSPSGARQLEICGR